MPSPGDCCKSTRWARPSSCSSEVTGARCCSCTCGGLGGGVCAVESAWAGDFVLAAGPLFRTRKDKRALRIESLRLLSKAIRPLPGKALQDGPKVTDEDWRYRQRYADMIVHPEVAEVFRKRATIVRRDSALLR
jgi:hypothetical protein